MADPQYAAAPQAFTFQGRDLRGQLVGWSGSTPRRSVSHQYPKRAGGLREDMGRGPRTLDVRLEFIGPSCAIDYLAFLDHVDQDPFGLINHPIAGQWRAFCNGPQEDVDFARSTNEIRVRVTWDESNLDLAAVDDILDAATAAQNTTNQQVATQTAVATFMANVVIAQTTSARIIAKMQSAIGLLDQSTTPIDDMRTQIATVGGLNAKIIGTAIGIADKSQLLTQDVANYVDAATSTDLFFGVDTQAGIISSANTLLGIVLTSGDDLEATLIAASPSSAGAAEAVGQKDELIGACLALADAIKSEKPPLINFTVPRLTDVISIATTLYPNDVSSTRASEIMGLNRIKNPAAIPAGTVLRVYAK